MQGVRAEVREAWVRGKLLLECHSALRFLPETVIARFYRAPVNLPHN